MGSICILDFETTGLNADIDEIIEYGFKIYNEDILIESYVKPNFMNISKRITEITGIKPDMVEGSGISQLDACNNIEQFIINNNIQYLLAHNGHRFDFLFLSNMFKRNYKVLPNIMFIDTIDIFKKLIKIDSYSQQRLCKYYKVDQKNAHRAMGDVIDLENICNCGEINKINMNKLKHNINQVNDLHGILHNIEIFNKSQELTYEISNLNSKERRLVYLYIDIFNNKNDKNYKHEIDRERNVISIIK